MTLTPVLIAAIVVTLLAVVGLAVGLGVGFGLRRSTLDSPDRRRLRNFSGRLYCEGVYTFSDENERYEKKPTDESQWRYLDLSNGELSCRTFDGTEMGWEYLSELPEGSFEPTEETF